MFITIRDVQQQFELELKVFLNSTQTQSVQATALAAKSMYFG